MGGQGSGGHNRKPVEQHRRLGTLQPVRHGTSNGDIPAREIEGIPSDTKPIRPLGSFGSDLWQRSIDSMPWLGLSDIEALQHWCEVADELQVKRIRVLGGNGTWRDEVALRKLEASYREMMRELGGTPIARARGTLAEVSAGLMRARTLQAVRDSGAPKTKDIIVEAVGS